MFRSGFVSITGRPNVGKSTLLNALVGFKAAIVSDKPQTTRNRIQAVLNRKNSQVIFLDTPGIHRPRNRLGNFMLWSARSTFQEADLLLLIVDGTSRPGGGDTYITRSLQGISVPVFLVVNKTDLLRKNQREKRLESYRELYPFQGVFSVSALTGHGLEGLVEELEGFLPEGPRYFPPDMVTDQPEAYIIGEIVREKLLLLTREEVPFSIAVEVEEMKKRSSQDLVEVRATVYVEKNNHKGIIIGKGGNLLKIAGSKAREELEALLGTRIYLDLWVKVKRDWRDQAGFLKQMGLRKD